MKKTLLMLLVVVAVCAGCVQPFTLVEPGEQAPMYGGLKIKTSQAWNRAPKIATPVARKDSVTWTQDGLLLDRIIMIPGVPDGEAIFNGIVNLIVPIAL